MASSTLSTILRVRGQGPVLMLSLGHGATHWITGTLYILLPVIKESLGLSYAEAGLFLSCYHISSFFANFMTGLAVDVSGRRVLVQVIALLVGAAAMLVFGLSSAFVTLCFMIGLMGAANQAWHPGAIAYLADRYAQQRGYVLSIHAMGANAGDALGPMIAGILLTWLSWGHTALISAVPSIVMSVVLIAMLLPSDKAVSRETSAMGIGEYFSGYASLLKDRAVMVLALTAAFRTMAQVGLFAFLPLYIVDVMQKSTVYTGAALMIIQIGGLVASPIAGLWSDRIGRRPIVFGALGLSSVLILTLTFISDVTLYVAGISLLGFFLFSIRPVVQSWMMDLVPPRFSGSATSLMFGTQAILGALAPILGGLVADRYGLVAVFYCLAGIMLFANALVLFIPKRTIAVRI
ncbi:MAG: MFS transporter [Alphaproteobacteria bacterium]|nr:MFS transporter [Alphaproteobacteria bacterium]